MNHGGHRGPQGGLRHHFAPYSRTLIALLGTFDRETRRYNGRNGSDLPQPGRASRVTHRNVFRSGCKPILRRSGGSQPLRCAWVRPGQRCRCRVRSLPERRQRGEGRVCHRAEAATRRRMQAAYEAFAQAASLVPHNVEYLTARELTRQKFVFDDLIKATPLSSRGHQTEALASFRSALELDPKNDFAQQRIRDVAGEWAPAAPTAPRVVQYAGVLTVEPDPVRRAFTIAAIGTTFTQVARAFGLSITFDDRSCLVRFNSTLTMWTSTTPCRRPPPLLTRSGPL